MALSTDDDMVVHHDAEQAACLGDPACDLDVGPAGLGIPAGVVVHEDHRGRTHVERLTDDLARVDRRLVDRAVADVMIYDQAVAGVEVENANPVRP